MSENNAKLQQAFIDGILEACEIGELYKVKALLNEIDFQSKYHIVNESARKIYIKACLSGHLDIVESLIHFHYLPLSSNASNSILLNAFGALIENNQQRSHHIISYIMNEPKLKDIRWPPNIAYSGFFAILDCSLKNAANIDDLDLFKVLLNLENNEYHNSWICGTTRVFESACSNNTLNVFKYLFNEPKLKHPEKDIHGFMAACYEAENNNLIPLSFLIFDYKIEKTKEIEDYINYCNISDVNHMFALRDLNHQLNDELFYNQDSIKKSKV
jgi:hypothetical protein